MKGLNENGNLMQKKLVSEGTKQSRHKEFTDEKAKRL